MQTAKLRKRHPVNIVLPDEFPPNKEVLSIPIEGLNDGILWISIDPKRPDIILIGMKRDNFNEGNLYIGAPNVKSLKETALRNFITHHRQIKEGQKDFSFDLVVGGVTIRIELTQILVNQTQDQFVSVNLKITLISVR